MTNGIQIDTGLQDLVFGIVAPIGTELDPFSRTLGRILQNLGYVPRHLKLSDLLKTKEIQRAFELDLEYDTEGQRYDKFMTAGNKFREGMKRGDALSMVAVGAIREIRERSTGSGIQEKNAFILRSLKHPAEVKSLRNIYGPAFVLFSLASSRTARVNHLAKKLCDSNLGFRITDYLPEAERLINRDEQEVDESMGQNVSKVFHLADFFIDVDHGMEDSVKRLVELFLGNVFITPTRTEQGMFLAHASSWRTASLQRQVGAVITTQDGDVIAVGTNEAAKPNGGLYWEGDNPDFRDFQYGSEINDVMKHRMFLDVIRRVVSSGMTFSKTHPLASEDNPQKIANWLIENGHMENARILNVIEFGRCVHAEMAALMDAARRGVSVGDSYLFSTTFPCHECARHIVAAGIRKVYYIEPYPKSLVDALYPDSIRIEGQETDDLVNFVPFVGVAPRRYQDVFKMGDQNRKKLVEHAKSWNSAVATPRLGEYPDRTQWINRYTEKMLFEKFALELEDRSNGNDRTRGRVANKSNSKSSPRSPGLAAGSKVASQHKRNSRAK